MKIRKVKGNNTFEIIKNFILVYFVYRLLALTIPLLIAGDLIVEFFQEEMKYQQEHKE